MLSALLRWSEETRIKSGVPQESKIESLLFLWFVNNLPSVIKMMTLLFADDIKMVSPRSQSGLLQDSLYITKFLSSR